MIKFFIVFILHFIFNGLFAQTNSKLIIAKTIDKKDYFYIPNEVFLDSVKAVLYQDMIGRKINPLKTPIELYWNSFCTDGDYILMLTPEQIFFTSGHNNPNPNRLFWVFNINTEQYLFVRNGFIKNPPNFFKNLSQYYNGMKYIYYDSTYNDRYMIPAEWNDSIMFVVESYCKKQIEVQISKYMSIINGYITDDNLKIVIPRYAELSKIESKYFSDEEYMLKDYLKIPNLRKIQNDTLKK